MRAHGSNDRGGAYNHRKWRRLRRYQLARQPLCEMCLAAGRVRPAEVVHHIEPHDNDRMKFFYGALQSLCRDCHETHHGRTPRPWIGADGWPLSPMEQALRKAEHDIKREMSDDNKAND